MAIILEPRIFRRLFRENVKGRACDAFFRQSRVNRVFIDDAAARTVNQANGRLHHFNLVGVNHIERLLVLGDVDGDVIGLFEDSFELVGDFDTQLFGFRRDGKRVIAENLHIETPGHFRDGHTDSAQAYYAQRFIVELVALVLFPVPGAAFKRIAGGDNVPAHRQHQRHSMFGCAEGIAAGRIHNKDALACRFFYVNVIDTDACAGDGLESSGIGKDLGGNFGCAADNQAVVAADYACQLIFAYAGLDGYFDVGHCFKQVDAFLCEFVCNQNLYH